ncbi:MAG: hypothetical protein AB7V58_04945 [Solirubrobacterales bacterium]
MPGLRIHLTGSAAIACEDGLLANAHAFTRRLCERLISADEGLLTGAGGEPVGDADLPCIFDWTALETIAEAPRPDPNELSLTPVRFVAVASQSGLEQVPEGRKDTWRACRGRVDFKLETTPPGWRMAGLIRARQLLNGDVLIVLGGGAGGELLAQQYREEGKPVIPIHSDLGALNDDGKGGGRYLHEKALSEVDRFFRLRDGTGDAASRLSFLRLDTDSDPDELAAAAVALIGDLRPRPAFYVRLLDPDHPDFREVESFFREVVDPVAEEKGYRPDEMGMHRPEDPFMNVEIFKRLDCASLVVVDLTGIRPNCMLELGYALGRRRRFLLSARKGTHLPFDPDKLPTYFWDPATDVCGCRTGYAEWFDLYSESPPIGG